MSGALVAGCLLSGHPALKISFRAAEILFIRSGVTLILSNLKVENVVILIARGEGLQLPFRYV